MQFYIGQNLLEAWSGKLDFNNTLPPEGSTLTFADGTLNDSVTFEFDYDQSVFGSGAPTAIPNPSNQQVDLTVEGNFSYYQSVNFLVEIDSLGNPDTLTSDTFRWSINGGVSYIQEFIPIDSINAHDLMHDLSIRFGDATGHGLGDRWDFTAVPMHNIVSIFPVDSLNANIKNTRDELKRMLDAANSQGLLSLNTTIDSDNNSLYLHHSMSREIVGDITITGSALSTSVDGTIVFNDNDLNGDGEEDNFILAQARDGITTQPFGATWKPDTIGNFIIFAIAEDSAGNRVTSSSRVVSVVSAVGELPEIVLDGLVGETTTYLSYSDATITESVTAVASDPDGQISEVSFYVNGDLVSSATASPYTATVDFNSSGHYEVYAVARDNSGNLVTSNIRRFVVEGEEDVSVTPLTLSASTPYVGGIGEVTGTYLSSDGTYDANIKAMVYVDGVYVQDADLLPRVAPGPGEEDPGQSFIFELSASTAISQNIEWLVVNGDETASGAVSVFPKETPISDELEFLNELYLGLFDRKP